MIEIGKCGKPHGLDGTLKCWIDERYMDDVLQANALFISIAAHPIPFFIESAREGNSFLVKLEEVNSREEAEKLAHKAIFLREEDLLESEKSEEEFNDNRFEKWMGYQIIDKDLGLIGVMTQIYRLPGHITAEISNGEKEVLIPMHERLILGIDPEKKQLFCDLPEGLLNL
jgi:16S rRNA processing protein RimM